MAKLITKKWFSGIVRPTIKNAIAIIASLKPFSLVEYKSINGPIMVYNPRKVK
jgi:hypothetical protein